MGRKERITIIISMMACLLILAGGLRQMDLDIYNDGICKRCDGELEFEREIGHSSYIEFEYVCIECGKAIRIETNIRENK